MEPRYWAFISYSHRDEPWAKWLHRKLETYRVPKRLVGSASRSGGPVPRRLFPIFRDRDELEGAASLSGRIEETLQQSRSLVVVCSPAAAQSKWVEEEIQAFRRLNGDEHVLAFVVSGEPNASDQGRPEDECFPRGLRVQTTAAGALTGVSVEPLAADARDVADGKRGALLKIVAAIAGLRYDDLRQRDAQRRMRMMALSAAVLGVVALIMAGLAAFALFQQRNAIAGRLAVESRFEVDKHYDLSLLLANEAVQVRGTLETRSALLSAVLRQPHPAAQLRLHSKRVYGLAFSPDGRTLATGGGDGLVALWDVTTRQRSPMPPLDVGGEVTSAAFNPEGTLIAVGKRAPNTTGALNAGSISYWDVATGKQRHEVAENDETAWALRFTPDGRLLSADGDGRAALWRVGQRQPEWTSTRVNQLAGFDVALDMHGQWIAVGGENSELSLVSFNQRNKALPLPKIHRGLLEGVAFSPVEETLASVDSNGTVVLWNLGTRMPRDHESADAGVQGVTRVAYTPDGKRLAIGNREGTVLMWDVDAREPRELVVTGHGDTVLSLAFNPDGTLLAVGLESGLVLLADLRGGEQLLRRHHLPGDAWDVATTADGRALVATEEGLHEVRFNPSAATDTRLLAPGFFWRVAVAHDDSTYVATRTCREAHDPLIEVIVANARDSSPQVISQCEMENYTVSLSRDATMLAIGRLDGTIDVRVSSDRWAPRSVLGKRTTLREAVDATAFSPDGALLAVGRRSGSIELWKTADRTLARSWKADPKGISTLAFTADGLLLASGADSSVRLWNVASAAAVGVLQTAQDVDAVAFSPDGRLLGVVAGDDGVTLWDVSTLQAFGDALKADPGVNGIDSLRAVTFTSDGRFLVTVATDGQLLRWDLRVETMLRHACYSANRTFTPGEWALFGSWWGRRSCQ